MTLTHKEEEGELFFFHQISLRKKTTETFYLEKILNEWKGWKMIS
jgi:hypothetical protein